jgi:D-sedoheptulose 7-phosphate isomerase
MDAEIIRKRFEENAAVLEATRRRLSGKIQAAAGLLTDAYRAGGGLFLFGNGGSAADAQHIAGELVGRFLKNRKALQAECLGTNPALLTALANDFSFDRVFVRELEGNSRAGDVAWGLSTSGNSPNVVAGLKYAKEHGLKTIALTGEGGGQCAAYADVLLDVPSKATPRVQEAGTLVYHLICELVEAAVT